MKRVLIGVGKSSAIALIGVGFLAAGSGVAMAAPVLQRPNGAGEKTHFDPAKLVNPFIGTGSGGKVTGDVDTFPGAVMPFGMLSWSPTTPSRPEGGDYFYDDSSILGFSLTHLSGPGCPAGGQVPILPTTGPIGAHPGSTSEPFSHAHEHASPGVYRVVLAPQSSQPIGVTLTVTPRTGLGVFRFPLGSQGNFVFKIADAQGGSASSAVRFISDRKLAGMETSGHFCGSAGSTTLYFVAVFNRPFQSHGTWQGRRIKERSNGSAGAATGAWVSFAAKARRTIKLKVAISYVSTAAAWQNLRTEDPGWNEPTVAARARQAWNGLLARVRVQGGTHDQRVEFYTALYHALLHPNVFSDSNDVYMGFDRKLHRLKQGQAAQYANFSGWDIYRSEIPLLALLVPHRVSDMVRSLLNDQHQGGWLPKWGYDNDYTGVMNGDAADPVIAEAYAFGARNFDAKAALLAMVKGATQTSQPATWSGGYVERPHLNAYERLGYVPGNASETLEYALADASIAQLAKALGDSRMYRNFLRRSGDWRNVFDPDARFRGYRGYAEPRSAKGTFAKPAGFAIRPKAYGQRGFEEGNTIQYTWMVPQDLKGLIRAMGGKRVAVQRLDILFEHLNVGPNKPYYWAGNEPGLSMPWIYDYAGAPYRTQMIVHRLINAVYSDSPGGEPGNDDLGAMSSWLVWSDLGMYPETPGAPILVLGAPIFRRVAITLGNGRQVTIVAPHASLRAYVEGLRINGRRWGEDWLPISLLLDASAPRRDTDSEDTRLDFSMGAAPDTSWAASPSSEPPSYTAKRQ